MVKTTKNKKVNKKLHKKTNKLKSKSRTLKKKTFRKKAGFLFKSKKQAKNEELEKTFIKMNEERVKDFLIEKAKPIKDRNLELLKLIKDKIKSNNANLNNIFANNKSKYQRLEGIVDIKEINNTIKETEQMQPKTASTVSSNKTKKPEQLAPLPSCWKQVFDKDFNRSYVRSDGLKADKNNRPSPDAECP
tara:strand:- start:81 stop:650 length:570 start_codon:yes stop_codon:yes gene_type:complete